MVPGSPEGAKWCFCEKRVTISEQKKAEKQLGYYGWGKYWHSKLTDKLEKKWALSLTCFSEK